MLLILVKRVITTKVTYILIAIGFVYWLLRGDYLDDDSTPSLPYPGHGYICPIFDGGIGNQMFQFASSYGIARSKNMKMLMAENCKLLNIFNINVVILKNVSICNSRKFQILTEDHNAVFDEHLMAFDNDSNVRLRIYLQSYHYFDKHRSELRQQFSFRLSIQQEADSKLEYMLKTRYIICKNRFYFVPNVWRRKASRVCFNTNNNKTITLVGIHVRRGDMLRSPHPQMGFQTASKRYLERSVDWYSKKYKNIIFILASNGMNWSKKNIPPNVSVLYLEGNSLPVDMAILALCDHFISTVGTFGWWIAWLAGGNVTYYKWPARENSIFREAFDAEYKSFFYPNWVGL